MSEELQVVLVEDHPSMRSGLTLLLAKRGFRVTGAAESVREGAEMITARRPDVAVIDIDLGDGSGTTLARRVAASEHPIPVVLYTGRADQAVLEDAVDSGASGVVLKTSPIDDLAIALRSAAAGGTFVDQAVSRSLRDAGRHTGGRLSPREAEVLAMLAHGQTSAQVARELVLSEQTVETHVRNACQKLHARGRLHAVIIALGSGELALRDLTEVAP